MGKTVRSMRDIYVFVKAVIKAVGDNDNDQELGKAIRNMVLHSDEHFEIKE